MENVHWMIYRPTNTLFTGREDILSSLEATIRDAVQDLTRSEPCTIVISGMGAQGKSEISLQLARRVRNLCEVSGFILAASLFADT